MPSFIIGANDFLLNGEPFRVLSGALHYFRVHPEHWADRIEKAKMMGLNTIETYVPWNEHSPTRGEFRTPAQLDLARFLDLVKAAGMYAIVRPGPYICAEWTDGGLPGWLTADTSVKLRTNDPAYMEPVREYLASVYGIVGPRQLQHGGPVILVQVENEYGAYGSDKDYLRELTALTRTHGIDVPLTSVDQPTDEMLSNGSIDGLHRTGSFGSRANARLATLRQHQPTGPLMCSEFWCGWFDQWGAPHRATSAEDSARELAELLDAGASVNIYMFHGGTNFGFTSGADDKGTYRPTTTSYDYGAPLAEDGTPTEKYWRFRDVLAKYGSVPAERPAERSDSPAFEVALERSISLWEAPLPARTYFDQLPVSTDFGWERGFAVYSTTIDGGGLLTFEEVRDRAQVFLNGTPVGVLNRDHHERMLALPADARGELTLLLENLGGVNYGPRIGEAKGLIGPATLNGKPLAAWSAGGLMLEDLPAIRTALQNDGNVVDASTPLCGPVFASGTLDLPAATDLHLDTSLWGKGTVLINGFNLGRYWSRGPQGTLYVPAPVLRAGKNEIIVFETVGGTAAVLQFLARPELGATEE